MGPAGEQTGWGGAARAFGAWRAARESVRVRWSAPMSPLRRVLLVILGALMMVALTVVGLLALMLIVAGMALTALAIGVRRLWWAVIGRPTGGPDVARNELRRNVRVRGE